MISSSQRFMGIGLCCGQGQMARGPCWPWSGGGGPCSLTGVSLQARARSGRHRLEDAAAVVVCCCGGGPGAPAGAGGRRCCAH